MEDQNKTNGEGKEQGEAQENQSPNQMEQKSPAPNQNAGAPTQETPNAIEEAKRANSEMKLENDRREKLLQREEALHAEKIAMGRGSIIPKTEKAPLTDKEYWGKIKKGENPNI